MRRACVRCAETPLPSRTIRIGSPGVVVVVVSKKESAACRQTPGRPDAQGLRFHFAGNRYIATSSEIKTLGLFPTCADGRSTVVPSFHFSYRHRPMVDDCTIWSRFWITIPNTECSDFNTLLFLRKRLPRILISSSNIKIIKGSCVA